MIAGAGVVPAWGRRARHALVVAVLAAVIAVAAAASGPLWITDSPARAQAHRSAPRAPFAEYDTVHRALDDELDTNRFGYDREMVRTEIARLDAAIQRPRSTATPDARSVAEFTDGLKSEREFVRGEVAQWHATYDATDANRTNTSGTDAEAALIAVSGGAARFSIDDACSASGSTRGALACVNIGATVHVPAEQASRSDADLLRAQRQDWAMVMTHEYAHVVQNRYRDALLRDLDFDRLFGDLDPPSWYSGPYELEASAECMAAVRMPGYVRSYPVTCTPEQLAMAQRIWNGDV